MTARARPTNARLSAGRLDPLSLRERGDREVGVRVTSATDERLAGGLRFYWHVFRVASLLQELPLLRRRRPFLRPPLTPRPSPSIIERGELAYLVH